MTRNYLRFLRIAVLIGAFAVAGLLVSTRSASAAPGNLAITPTTCSTAGGTVLTITGTGFAATPTVTFGVGFPNPTVVTATFVSSTQITVIAPARAAGNSGIMVTNPDGSLDSLNPGCMYVAPTPTGSIGGQFIPQSNYSFPMACVDGTSIFGRLPNKKLIERGGSFSNSTATASTTNSGGEGYGSTVSIKGDSNQAAPTLFEFPKPQSNYAVLQSVDSLSALDICDGTGCPLKVLTAFSYQVLTAAEMLTAEALQKGEVASASAPVATLNSSTIVKNVTITVTDLSLDQPRSFIGLRRWTGTQWEIVASNWGRIELRTPQTGVYAVTTASTEVSSAKDCPGGQNLKNANLIKANLIKANLSGANLSFADLTGADLTEANLKDGNLSGAWLGEAKLTFANLSGANLRGAYLVKANLRGANLVKANLMEANLRLADLTGAFLSSPFTSEHFTGADLTGADLTSANLVYTNLSNANLTNANLTGAFLMLADLTGANLSNANLTNANLAYTNLSNANLSNADLMGADLRDANLSNANLAGAKGANLPGTLRFYDDR